jgi:hypothetical protein
MDSMGNLYLEDPWKGFHPEDIRSMQMRSYRRAMLTTYAFTAASRPDGHGIPGIIVLDLATGRARGVLDHEKSTTGSSPISVDGVMMRGPDGQPLILHDPQISLWTDAHSIGANESRLNRFARMPRIPLRARRAFPTHA